MPIPVITTHFRRSALICLAILGPTVAMAQEKSAAPAPAKATAADFRGLKFLEGRWRGTGYQTPFFENYRFVNDSTIEMHSAADSTFRNSKPGSRIEFRAGTIYMGDGQSRYAVTRIDKDGYRFTELNGRGAFVWKRENANEWTAVLGGGAVYRMYRIQ